QSAIAGRLSGWRRTPTTTLTCLAIGLGWPGRAAWPLRGWVCQAARKSPWGRALWKAPLPLTRHSRRYVTVATRKEENQRSLPNQNAKAAMLTALQSRPSWPGRHFFSPSPVTKRPGRRVKKEDAMTRVKPDSTETCALLERAGAGDPQARDEL